MAMTIKKQRLKLNRRRTSKPLPPGAAEFLQGRLAFWKAVAKALE